MLRQLHSLVTTLGYNCNRQRLIGGRSDGDGIWPICLDGQQNLLQDRSTVAVKTIGQRGQTANRRQTSSRCYVFSLGSNNEFSFDDAMAGPAYNCQVATFDPTVNWPTGRVMRGSNIAKYGVGVKGHDGRHSFSFEKYRSLQELLDLSMFPRLNVLKLDVEGSEWTGVLSSVLEMARQKRLDQFLVEVHFIGNEFVGSHRTRASMDDRSEVAASQMGSFLKSLDSINKEFALFYSHLNQKSVWVHIPLPFPCCFELGYIRRGLMPG